MILGSAEGVGGVRRKGVARGVRSKGAVAVAVAGFLRRAWHSDAFPPLLLELYVAWIVVWISTSVRHVGALRYMSTRHVLRVWDGINTCM